MKLKDIGEFGFIGRLKSRIEIDKRVIVGIGDDAAGWQGDTSVQLATVDALIQDIHFSLEISSGEELGWRGFLLPRLLPLGQWRAIVLSGAIWGFWHAPVILHGHNYPTQPVLGVFMMLIFCALVGAIFSWLYLRALSPWARGLALVALNATGGTPMLFLTGVDIAIGGL